MPEKTSETTKKSQKSSEKAEKTVGKTSKTRKIITNNDKNGLATIYAMGLWQ
jgi:hypothetical protein